MDMNTWSIIFQGFSAAGFLAGGVAAWFAFLQVKQMKIVLEDSRKWNKMSSSFSLFPSRHEFNEIECKLNDCIKIIDRNTPLCEEEMKQLFDTKSSENRILLKNYLNQLEGYCTAVNMGVVDEGVAKRLFAHKITRHFIEMKPYIDRLRAELNNNEICGEIERAVERWNKKPPEGKQY